MWLKTFPVPEESPARHVRDLRICTGGRHHVPEEFFEYTQWFSNVERVCLVGCGEAPPLRRPSLWRLPQSATSLLVNTDAITLVQVRDAMAQLPNLDNLSLLGFLVAVNRKELVGIGAVLKGRFGGKLMLYGEYVDEDVINMLLEVPTGLGFTELQTSCTPERFPSAVRLAEACGKTLLKLSHLHRKPCPSS